MPSPSVGPRSCENCFREFVVKITGVRDRLGKSEKGYQWHCPHCGHDNKSPGEIARHAARIAAAKSAANRRKRAACDS